MDDNKRQLIGSILAFLKNELTAPYLSAEDLEGLEVAIQCLESTYNVPTSSAAEPPLEEIYKTFLATSVKNRPDASDDAKKEAERLKVEGNIAMTAQSYNEALELYTSAISYDSKNAVYYCNRAAAYSKLFDHKSAINDCKMAIELDPKYSKAYGRLGLAYTGLDDYQKALENYRIAAQLDPDNDGYRNNVLLAERKINETEQSSEGTSTANPTSGNGPNFDFNMVFGNPQLLSIATQMLSDPTMQNMMSSIMTGTLAQDGSNRMEVLIEAGQQLAQQMQTEQPNLVDQLRQTLGNVVDQSNPPQSGSQNSEHDDSGQNKEG